jgi:hypothetical protein
MPTALDAFVTNVFGIRRGVGLDKDGPGRKANGEQKRANEFHLSA